MVSVLVGLALLFSITPAWAQALLGTAQSFAVLGGSTVTNTGPTIVTGNLGVEPGSAVTGFPPGIVLGGTIHIADGVALQAQSDNTTAYNVLAGQACDFDLTGQDLVGMTLVQGVYCFSSSAQLSGTLTLDAQGDPGAVWVFQIGSTLTTASASAVRVINGGQQCNVYWQIGSSATLGTTTSFIGNILALTSITLTTGATVAGRALAQNGAVTMDSNTVSIAACAVPPVTPIPPTVGKAFDAATIDPGGVSTLTITLSNPNATAATLTSPLVDTLPAGVTIASPPNASTTCVGSTVSATAGGSSVTLTGGAIPAGVGGGSGTCVVTVDVTATAGGAYFNTIPIGALQTSNGSNPAPAVATLTVPQPATAPTLGKAFDPATIAAGGTSTLTVTLSNANTTPATLTAPLVDTLPAGVVIASTPNASTTCPGSTVAASANGTTVTLTGGAIPAAVGAVSGTCTFSVDVTAPVGGSYFNTLPAGALQTSNGSNAAPAIATLTVTTPANTAPTLGKAFSPATINAGGTSILTITLSNSNATAATLTAPLTDTLPAGVVIASVPNASTTCVGSSVAATAGGSSVTLTGGAIPAAVGSTAGTCTVTVSVTAPVGGSFFNTLPAGALQTSNGNNAAPAIATLTVTPGSTVALGKTFTPATIDAGEITTLVITLTNTGTTAASLTAPLTDTLPAGLVIATPNNASTTCGGTLTFGVSSVTLTGGAIPALGSCVVTVDALASVAGSYFNVLPAGALQTTNGNNPAPAVATVTVVPVPIGECQKTSVRAVLDPLHGRFPGNRGPDIIVRVGAPLNQSIQAAVDALATRGDLNGDGYQIILVVNKSDGSLGGTTSQRVEIKAKYAKPFALIACSVTMRTPDGTQPSGHIFATASSPGNIFVMDLHGADSLAGSGWQVEGNGRYLQNVNATGNKVGIALVGNGNVVNSAHAENNATYGVSVKGNSNSLENVDAFNNGGDGFRVVGTANRLNKIDAGERGKPNSGDGLRIEGDSNQVIEASVFANFGRGIFLKGNSNSVAKSNVGDRSKGNSGDGVRVEGNGNILDSNHANANGAVGFNFASTAGNNNVLKKNESNQSAAGGQKENGGAEYCFQTATTIDQGGNKKDNATFAGVATSKKYAKGCYE